MNITGFETNEAIMREWGIRLRDVRIQMECTQDDLAKRAGVSKKTVSNLESGKDVSTGSLLRVVRALGLLDRAQDFIPAHEIRPSDVMLAAPKVRQRVRGAKQAAPHTWKWGDEQ